MKKRDFTNDEYYTFVNNLPRLSQEEIVSLYESENIPYTDLDLEILELENKEKENLLNEELEEKLAKLKSKKKGSVAYRYFLTLLGRKYNVRRYPSSELRNRIAEGTMYLVLINAKKIYKMENNNLDFDDLFQCGTEALLSAAFYYVPGGEAKFESYASKCIRNKMFKVMCDSRKMKRTGKAKNFFEKEWLRIKEIELLLETEKCPPRYGGYRPGTEEHLIVHRLNRNIVHYNQDKDKRMEHNRKVRKVYGKSIEEILERYRKLLKNSKLNELITDYERRDIESFLAYKNYSGVELTYYRSQFYLDFYKYKLKMLEKYISAENKLIKKGVDPTLENVVSLINEEIRNTNKKIAELKKEDFYERCREKYMIEEKFSYKPLVSYYEEYYRIHGVNLLKDEDYDYDESPREEKDFILSDYEDALDDYDFSIEKLSNEDSELVCVYYDEDDRIVQIGPYVPYQELDEDTKEDYESEEEYYDVVCYYADCEKYVKVSRKEFLKKQMEERIALGSKEEYLKGILKERARVVNESLKEKNAPIIEENLQIRELEDLYNLGERYQRYLKEKDVSNLKDNINLLYSEDPEFVDLLLDKDKSKSKRLTVEEEVLDKIFLEDYYAALDDLDDLQREILKIYYDENGCKRVSLKEIANILGISFSKAKVEKAKALKKLRNNKVLYSYYIDN